MGERRVLQSIRLQQQISFDRELIALNKASAERMAAEAETVEVGYHLPPLPHVERRYYPCRERSLYSIVKRRSLRGRRSAGRQAGFNHGQNVIFKD